MVLWNLKKTLVKTVLQKINNFMFKILEVWSGKYIKRCYRPIKYKPVVGNMLKVKRVVVSVEKKRENVCKAYESRQYIMVHVYWPWVKVDLEQENGIYRRIFLVSDYPKSVEVIVFIFLKLLDGSLSRCVKSSRHIRGDSYESCKVNHPINILHIMVHIMSHLAII